jgi:lipopolysaccharide biosynthesis regulator YciM
MDLQTLISDIDFQFKGVIRVSLTLEEWQTLKTAVLAQQTTNKQSSPCEKCNDAIKFNFNHCPNCGIFLKVKCSTTHIRK